MFDYQTASGPCVQYAVGQQAQGGTIVWVDDSGQHGLVAANQDLTYYDPLASPQNVTTIPWTLVTSQSNWYVVTPRLGIWGGMSNTEKIIGKYGGGSYAAYLCANSSLNFYGDWYLPTVKELQLVFNSRSILSGLLTTAGDYYWTSNEYDNIQAYAINFGLGTTNVFQKDYFNFPPNNGSAGIMLHVRAVRSF
jgi:chondroitin AC lyase